MNKTKPKLRFKGFTDDWEQRKFSDGLKEYTERIYIDDQVSYNQISIQNHFGGIKLRGIKIGSKIGRKRQAIINLKKYPNTLIFTRQTIEQGGIGWAPQEVDGAIVTENMPTLSLNDSVFSRNYLTNFVQTEMFYKNGILNNLQGGSAQVSLHEDSLLKTPFFFPRIEEQNEIGSILLHLDNLITLHQRKLNLLENQKKSFLQKMFPKNGDAKPELRFTNFTDDWEQRKLGDIADSFEYGLNASAKEYDGKNKYLRITDIDESSHLFKQDALTTPDTDLNNAENFKLKIGDVLFARTGASVGKTYRYTFNDGVVYFAGFLIRGRFKETVCSEFIYQNTLTNKYKKYIKIMSQRSGQPGVNAQEYANFSLNIPGKDEQIKVSSYTSMIDNLITLHQRKLKGLEDLKKGLLQQMFV